MGLLCIREVERETEDDGRWTTFGWIQTSSREGGLDTFSLCCLFLIRDFSLAVVNFRTTGIGEDNVGAYRCETSGIQGFRDKREVCDLSHEGDRRGSSLCNISDARSGAVVDERIRPSLESGAAIGSSKPVLVIIDEIDGATGAGDSVGLVRYPAFCAS